MVSPAPLRPGTTPAHTPLPTRTNRYLSAFPLSAHVRGKRRLSPVSTFRMNCTFPLYLLSSGNPRWEPRGRYTLGEKGDRKL